MSCFLYENHWGSPTLTLLNVHGVLGVLNVLNVLHVLHTCASCALYAHGRIVGLLGLVPLAFHSTLPKPLFYFILRNAIHDSV